MPEEKESEKKERETLKESPEKMEKMQELDQSKKMPKTLRNPPLLSRMANMGAPTQDRIITETIKRLQKDMSDIKNYLREILEILKVQEK
ncbi:hypothetical protein AKJ57_00855 [candidate division MSBL1 archaeon SCGC-AAA259A05]|nr:hypothetical protein AKJ57_00855 [candidate division MSBL1 archaeon SCGC-AAA259A05]